MRRYFIFFFFNDTATTEIYTLSLHDALPISGGVQLGGGRRGPVDRRDQHRRRQRPAPADRRGGHRRQQARTLREDRKSTRLNSSHANISYAVFCLKKKKKRINSSNVRL